MVHHARLVIQQMDRLQDELGDYGHGFKGHVRLLCNTSALSEHLPSVLSAFLATHAGISIDLEERASDDIVDAIRNGLADMGVVSDLPDLDGLECFAFRPDPLVLVVPRDHPLSTEAATCLADVADAPFVGLVSGSALQEHIARHARRLGKPLNYRIRLGSFESVCQVVGAGIGIGIVPRAVASRCARSRKIRALALTDAWAARSLVLCVRRFDELMVHAQMLARHVLDSSQRRQATRGRLAGDAG
jgi:DNA-binding transcriptional LysR family regulator